MAESLPNASRELLAAARAHGGGCQLSVVSLNSAGAVANRWDLAVGLAQTPPRAMQGAPQDMTTCHLMDWQSTTKALTAVAAAVAHERRTVDVNAPVARYVPEFATHGKEDVTLRDCLTHVAGIPFAGATLAPETHTKEDIVRAICGAKPDNQPGEAACYHPYSSMYAVAECVSRASGYSFDQFVRDNIVAPLGLTGNAFLAMTDDEFAENEARLAELVATSRLDDARGGLSRNEVVHGCPASGLRATAASVATLMACVCSGGQPILNKGTVELFTRAHRVGMRDELQGVDVDWSLGFAVDSVLGGAHAGRRSFGHGGAQSSFALADPESGVVIAFAATHKPGTSEHYARAIRIADAVFEDLGRASSNADGAAAMARRPVPVC